MFTTKECGSGGKKVIDWALPVQKNASGGHRPKILWQPLLNTELLNRTTTTKLTTYTHIVLITITTTTNST